MIFPDSDVWVFTVEDIHWVCEGDLKVGLLRGTSLSAARGVAPLKPCILQGWSVWREMYLWGRFTYPGITSQTPIGQVPAQRNGEGGCVNCSNVIREAGKLLLHYSRLHPAWSVMRVPLGNFWCCSSKVRRKYWEKCYTFQNEVVQ